MNITCKLSLLLGGLFLAATVLAGLSTANGKPTRSSCIIGFYMNWTDVADVRASKKAMSIWPSGKDRIEGLVAQKISDDNARIYFQFNKNCDHKHKAAAVLFEFWEKEEDVSLPDFTGIEGRIVPSVDTIDVQGPYWSE